MCYRLRTLLILMAVGPPVLAGCANKRVPHTIPSEIITALEHGEEFELLSLEPTEGQADDESRFRKWKVLGKTALDEDTRLKLVAAFKQGVAENAGVHAACFIPRHGIQVRHGGKVFNLVICFECMWARTYIDAQEINYIDVSRSPQPVFDDALIRGSVPLAKPSPH